jgi:hypothetical protein
MNIGFKEWALVCDALGRGEQSVILRKGGIAEGRDGFRFKHAEFFLLPTLFHEQVARTRLPADTRLPEPKTGIIEIRHLARVEWYAVIKDWDIVEKLTPHHIWQESEIEARFNYDKAAELNLAFVRVFRLEPAWSFPDAPAYGGCRSWVTLPEFPKGTRLVPVLNDATNAAHSAELKRLAS